MTDDQRTITVCDFCLRAACWQGKHMCGDYLTAGTVEKTVAELRKLDLEHPCFWTARAQDGGKGKGRL